MHFLGNEEDVGMNEWSEGRMHKAPVHPRGLLRNTEYEILLYR